MTLAIATILVGFALPAFDRVTTNSQLDRVARELQSAILLVRSEAIKRNDFAYLVQNTDWNDGWLITTNIARTYDDCLNLDINDDDEVAECIRVFQPAETGYTIETDVVTASLDYRRSGRAVQNLVFTICPDPVGSGYVERVVTIGTTGLPQISHEDECA